MKDAKSLAIAYSVQKKNRKPGASAAAAPKLPVEISERPSSIADAILKKRQPPKEEASEELSLDDGLFDDLDDLDSLISEGEEPVAAPQPQDRISAIRARMKK
jgi:hypothetical protein